MPSTVDAATILLAELRRRVAAVHAAVTPDPDLPAPDAPEPEAPDPDPDLDLDLDLEALAAALDELAGLLVGFDALLPEEPTSTLRQEVGWALDRLTPARDLEAGVDLLDELVDDLDPALRMGPVADRIGIGTAASRADHRTVVAGMLGQPEWTSLLSHADALVLTAPLDHPGEKKTARVLARAVAGADASVLAALDAADEATDPVTRAAHRRTAAVGARHLAVTAGAARPVHGKRARKLAAAAADLATALETAAAAEGVAHRLVDLADHAHRSGEPSFTYGVLHTAARGVATDAEVAIVVGCEAYAKPKRRAWLQD